MGRYIRGNVQEKLDLGTLAPSTLVSTNFDDVVVEKTLVSSLIASYSIDQFTPAANTGPFMIVIAHSDYSDAEIEQVIESTGSWDQGDLIDQEIGNRKVRIIGIMRDAFTVGDSMTLQNGKLIKTKLNWLLMTGQTLKFCVYNLGSVAVATTDPDCHCVGHVNLFPK